jgi:hypothetical protein
MHGSDPLLPF